MLDINEENDNEGGNAEDGKQPNTEELTLEQQIELKKNREKLDTVGKPNFYMKKFQLLVNVIRAEDLQVAPGDQMNS